MQASEFVQMMMHSILERRSCLLSIVGSSLANLLCLDEPFIHFCRSAWDSCDEELLWFNAQNIFVFWAQWVLGSKPRTINHSETKTLNHCWVRPNSSRANSMTPALEILMWSKYRRRSANIDNSCLVQVQTERWPSLRQRVDRDIYFQGISHEDSQ